MYIYILLNIFKSYIITAVQILVAFVVNDVKDVSKEEVLVVKDVTSVWINEIVACKRTNFVYSF